MAACPATKVIALPGSIVGSIGVISLRPMIADLLERVGVRVSVNKSGPLKDMGAIYRPSTEEEERKLQGLIDELFEAFVERVAQCRGISPEQVRSFATGEVFTGRRGKELGLVDELGDFDRALELAAELGKTRPRPVWVRPRRPLLGRLLGARVAEVWGHGLVTDLRQVLTGGMYYLAPPYLPTDILGGEV